MTRAIIVSDNSGHDYLIPYDLSEWFYEMLEEAESNEDKGLITEDMYTYESFQEEFETYRVEGDYEIYADFKNKEEPLSEE